MRAFRTQWKHHPVRTLAVCLGAALVTAVAAGYGALAIAHAVTLIHGGAGPSERMLAAYFFFGGLALVLGVLQFAPYLRRRYPLWHRANGLLVWLSTLCMLLAAIVFLAQVPPDPGAPANAVGLLFWSNALVTLFMLLQAIVAAFARDFRSHMVWMATVFASLATAPVLLIEGVIAGRAGLFEHLLSIDFAALTLIVPQMTLIMAFWLSFVGDRDVRTLPVSCHWPERASWMMCSIAIGAVLHEVALVPAGLDAFAGWRLPADRWPPIAIAWGVAVSMALLLAPATWKRALQGKPPSRRFAAATLLVAVMAAVLGVEIAPLTAASAESTFWFGYAVLLTLLLLLSYRMSAGSLRRNAWSVLLCAVLCMPCLLPVLLAAGWAAGASFALSRPAALVASTGVLLYLGLAFGYGARLRLWPAKPGHAVIAARGI